MKNQIFTFITALVFATSSMSAVKTAISKEERMKMADLHTQMAVCLSSEKAMLDCQLELEKSCQELWGKSKCVTMGVGHMTGMQKGIKAENKSKNKKKTTM